MHGSPCCVGHALQEPGARVPAGEVASPKADHLQLGDLCGGKGIDQRFRIQPRPTELEHARGAVAEQMEFSRAKAIQGLNHLKGTIGLGCHPNDAG